VLLCALFGIGWLAQVAFLAQQLPLLVPKVGAAAATLAVAATTASSLLGRLALASFMDRIDHRAATAGSFGLQALGMAAMAASDNAVVVVAGCCLMGASVGNVITLPAMFAQREFSPGHYGAVVTRIWSIGQVMYAFGPIGAGLLLTATGAPALPLLACMGCQLVAAGLCFAKPGRSPQGKSSGDR
jgi:MFS family permease